VGLQKLKQQKQEWLKEVETESFYPQMMVEQWMSPSVAFAEPSKRFISINKKEKILFDFDL
jgi:hypothetical protein